MNSLTRRKFLASSSFFAAPILLGGCVAPPQGQGAAGWRLGMYYSAPGTTCGDPNAYTPLGKSVCGYLESRAASSVSVVYRGKLVKSNRNAPGFAFNSKDQRSGELVTTVRYQKAANGNLTTKISQKLNGSVLNEFQPPFYPSLGMGVFQVVTATAIRYSNLPPNEKSVPVDASTGIGAPELSTSLSGKGHSIAVRPAGGRHVQAMGKSVSLWRWSGVYKNPFRSGQQNHFDTLFSCEIPGQIFSYAYQYSQDGRVVDQSSGELVDVI